MNFNAKFNVLLNKYIVHPLVKSKKYFDNIKLHGTTVKKRVIMIAVFFLLGDSTASEL